MLGISPQDLDSHEKWAAKLGLPFALLADVDKRVINAYGVKGFGLISVRRSVFVVDGGGIVRFADRKLVGASFVSANKIANEIASFT